MEENKKKKKKGKRASNYAPLIFEECYIKNGKSQINKVLNSFELLNDDNIKEKVNPGRVTPYKGIHLFVMCHGF